MMATEDVPMVDDDGNPMMDEAGEPMMEEQPKLDAEGNPAPVRRIYSDHLFIHEAAAYFD